MIIVLLGRQGGIQVGGFIAVLQAVEQQQKAGTADAVERIDSLVADRLSFRCPKQAHPVIQDISLQIEHGKKIASVGENASGKTTLIKCLIGLYDTVPEMIRINGEGLQDFDRASYQERIAVRNPAL